MNLNCDRRNIQLVCSRVAASISRRVLGARFDIVHAVIQRIGDLIPPCHISQNFRWELTSTIDTDGHLYCVLAHGSGYERRPVGGGQRVHCHDRIRGINAHLAFSRIALISSQIGRHRDCCINAFR